MAAVPWSALQLDELLAALGLGELRAGFYQVRMPAWNKEENIRHYIDFPFNLPHEIFAREWLADPASWDPLNYSDDDLPLNFSGHQAGYSWKHTRTLTHPLR